MLLFGLFCLIITIAYTPSIGLLYLGAFILYIAYTAWSDYKRRRDYRKYGKF